MNIEKTKAAEQVKSSLSDSDENGSSLLLWNKAEIHKKCAQLSLSLLT